jgi:regulatory protein
VAKQVAYGCVFLTMMRMITAIEPQKKDPKRVNIYLDGKYAFGLNGILAAWLEVGQPLTEEKMNSLVLDDGLESSYQKALHFISFRPRSVAEVRKNLAGRDVPEDLIDETIQHLQNNSVLDDAKFALDWVANRKEFRPRSHLALRMELRQKGIPEEIINKVLEETIDDESLALLAARKYEHRLEGLNEFEFRKKISAILARKGFSFSSINPVSSVVWNDLHPEAERGESIYSEEY